MMSMVGAAVAPDTAAPVLGDDPLHGGKGFDRRRWPSGRRFRSYSNHYVDARPPQACWLRSRGMFHIRSLCEVDNVALPRPGPAEDGAVFLWNSGPEPHKEKPRRSGAVDGAASTTDATGP